MKAIATLAAAAALVTLAGCDRIRGGGAANGTANASGNAANGTQSAGNQAGAQSADGAGGKLNEGGGAIPASSGPVRLDRTFLLGRWSDDGDCSADGNSVIEFTQDGRFIAANGGVGLWNLDGDRLTMSGNQTATIRLVPIDQDTMTVINADESLGRSTRC
jgi:hypothetical protein